MASIVFLVCIYLINNKINTIYMAFAIQYFPRLNQVLHLSLRFFLLI